jgi:hypothetical protein
MAVSLTLKVRCSNKNLIQGYVPPGGGTAQPDTVNATFAIIESSVASLTTGTVTFTYALTDDQFIIGNYYDMTMADGVAPVRTTPANAPPPPPR